MAGRFRNLLGGWAVFFLLLLLLTVLHLISGAVQDADGLSRLFVPLLIFAVVGLGVLLLLILAHVWRLWREYRQKVAGSRLSLRLVLFFLALSLPPVAIVYYYSMDILMEGIDRWFDVDIGASVEDSLALSQASMDLHKREKLLLTNYLWLGLQDSSQAALSLALDELREHYDAQDLLLLDFNNDVIASTSANPTQLLVEPPEQEMIRQVREGEPFVSLDPADENGTMQVRVVVADPKGRGLVLQARYETGARITELSEKVQSSYRRYKELEYLRESLRFSFGITLLLVLSFASLAAVWAAFFTARRLVAPVAQIADGTRAVALGNYDKQLPIPKNRDELGFLVSSFNAMTRSIALARDLAQKSQREVENQRTYLETVLGRLSSGVLTFDAQRCLRTANPAAHLILQVDLAPLYAAPLDQLAEERTALSALVEALEEPLAQESTEWRGEVTLLGSEGRQVLLCSLSPLAMDDSEAAGHVLVFDEITTLIRAQKDAAWGGIARRLAHEIKNPLTPIQLSAERLRHKLLAKLVPDDASILDRATRTTIQQVEALKEMVNAFSDYARPPKMQAQPLALDAFVNEVLDLYRTAETGPPLDVTLAADGARVEADPTRLRQVLINLVKNAQEELESVADAQIQVSTRPAGQAHAGYVELAIRDNGPGFSQDVLTHLFEPYITTKVKGTGLGLAIVKKIVEEHGGIIKAENLEQGGARILIYLPLMPSDETNNS